MNDTYGLSDRSNSAYTNEFGILDHANHVLRQAKGEIPNEGTPSPNSIFLSDDYIADNSIYYFPTSICTLPPGEIMERQAYCMSLDIEAGDKVCFGDRIAIDCLNHILDDCTEEEMDTAFGDPHHLYNILLGFGRCNPY